MDIDGDEKWIEEQSSQLMAARNEGTGTMISCRLLELHPIAINLAVTPVFGEDEAAQVARC